MNPIGEPLDESVHTGAARPVPGRGDTDHRPGRRDDPDDVPDPGLAARQGPDRGAAPLG